jgi:mitochondrial cardiolipin hydrolase
MTSEEIDAWLTRSLDDRRFSRNERRVLGESLASLGSTFDLEEFRHRAFEIACGALAQPDDRAVLEWLEEVIKASPGSRPGGNSVTRAESHFSPGPDCPLAIERLLARSRRTADICVFTITDDRLADAILDAHSRGVAVRIITDDAKADDLGSDVDRLARAGVSLRIDRSPFHMHHKFAILDGATLLTGSYNWTRGAARDNEENLIVTDEPRFISSFTATFARLWAKLA